MPAYYRCKYCGDEHKLPGRFPSKQLFDSVPMHQHVCTCPTVDRGAVYRGEDVFWRDDPDDAVRTASRSNTRPRPG